MAEVRKIISFVLLIAAAIALVGFFIGVGPIVFDPFKAAFEPKFDFGQLGLAVYGFIGALSTPLILFILGLIGLTVDNK